MDLQIRTRALPLARTVTYFCHHTNESFSHAYKHSPVCAGDTNESLCPLTRVQKTASRAGTTNDEAHDDASM